MRSAKIFSVLLSFLFSLSIASAESSAANREQTVWVCLFVDAGTTAVPRIVSGQLPPYEAALHALMAGPMPEEIESGMYSFIPEGTFIQTIAVEADSVSIDFSDAILANELTDVTLEGIYTQVSRTLEQFNLHSDVRLTTNGISLYEFLEPVPQIEMLWKFSQDIQPAAVGRLAGKSITLSPGHGRCWKGSSWSTARPVYCSPLNEEDYHNVEICQYLETYLLADGMTVKIARCTNKSYGNHPSGTPWWKMGSYVWLQHLGYPCSVYGSLTDCTTGNGASEYDDDIRARPLASNYDNTTIFVSLHTNGASGDCYGSTCPTGTITYYDAGTSHAAWGDISKTLATKINSSVVTSIKNNVDGTWAARGSGISNSNGSMGEIRIPERAAALVELGFHDTCDRDADINHLRDNFFRSAAMWGVYKGICDYFNVTPTYDFYSHDYVSDTFPTTMRVNETYLATLTLRNRGVLWNSSRGFALGAVGLSDPFTNSTLLSVGGEVGPGQDVTFSITLKAPASSGVYTTDWRMVRNGNMWWGGTLIKTITVNPLAPAITEQPQSQAVCPYDTAVFTIAAAGEGPLGYQWQKDGIDLLGDQHYLNVNTPTLTIIDVDQQDTGLYRCMVTNTGGTVQSDQAQLSLLSFIADFDKDCDVDISDVSVFASHWLEEGCITVDDCEGTNLDAQGQVDLSDLVILVEQWLAGM